MVKHTLRWDETGTVIIWEIDGKWTYDDAILQMREIIRMAQGCQHKWSYILINSPGSGFNDPDNIVQAMTEGYKLVKQNKTFAGILGTVNVTSKVTGMALSFYGTVFPFEAIIGSDFDKVYREVRSHL